MKIFRKIISLARDDDGSVAVEFALISIPVIYCTIAILELSMFFAAANMLEGGISQSARKIRIGQIQTQTAMTPEEAFREEVCNHLFGLVKCDDVLLEVVAMPDDEFTSVADYQPVYDENGLFVPREFNAGESGDVVVVRAYYKYQLMTPLFAQIFTRTDDETIPIMSTVILQSEPYDFDGSAEDT